jgi:hypothetical protein
MAYKKSYNKRTSNNGIVVKKTYRKKQPRAMIQRTPRVKLNEATTYKFKRSLLYQTISPTAQPLATFGGFAFRLSDLPFQTDFGALFDQYKLTGVKLMFIPRATDNTSLSSNAGNLMWFEDKDDSSSAGLTVETFYQKMSLKLRQAANRPFTIFIRPKCAITGTQSVSGNQIAQLPNTWLDMASPDALHYGIKWAWVNTNVGTTTIDIYATYYLQMRGVQ